MSENNNEIKWVEVEQTGAPAADPFEVEPKLEEVEAKAQAAEAKPVDNDPFGFDGAYNADGANADPTPEFIPNNGGYNYNGANTGAAFEEQPLHSKAVASLVLGIVGLCCCGFCSIIALVFGVQCKNAGNTEGFAKAGFILGIIGTALWAIGFVFNMATGIFS